MKRNLLVFMLALVVAIPAYTQQKAEPAKSDVADMEKEITSDTARAYEEVVLEDFETSQYTDKNVSYTVTKYQEGSASIRDQYPAPYRNSKKYLGVKFFGKDGDVLKIVPAKDLVIDKYCREIAIWVYGKRFAGELSILLQDTKQKTHRLLLGKMDYLGWRKLKVKLEGGIAQEDELLNQKAVMKILELQYRPANSSRQPIWHYFYLDDISAQVREKYTDRQSDDW